MAEESYERLVQIPTAELVAMALEGVKRQGEMVTKVIERVQGQLDTAGPRFRGWVRPAAPGVTGGGMVRAARPERVYLAGCGDSYFAALSARCAFEQLTGLPTVAVESLELARYTLLPPGSLVIVISSGGEVSATLEAGRVARQAGAGSIGITSQDSSRLVQEFPCLIAAPDFSSSDAAGQMALILGNFCFSLAALYLVALRLGQCCGHLDEQAVGEFEVEIGALPEAIEQATHASAEVQEYVEGVSDEADLYFVGAGPSHGVALFYQAKLFEQVQRPVYGIELEEFAHEQFLLLRPGRESWVWFIAPPGRSRERVLELMAGCREADAHVVAVASPHDEQVQGQAHRTFAVEADAEMFSPLVTAVPGEFLGIHAFGRWGSVVSTPVRRRQMAQLTRGKERERREGKG
jgi:glucosamine--fructose-6-phosphate aminotransferase (isomerizing)